jgi:hypothetical protein
MTFKSGDKVIAIRESLFQNLQIGKVYTIAKYDKPSKLVKLKEIGKLLYMPQNFRLANKMECILYG